MKPDSPYRGRQSLFIPIVQYIVKGLQQELPLKWLVQRSDGPELPGVVKEISRNQGAAPAHGNDLGLWKFPKKLANCLQPLLTVHEKIAEDEIGRPLLVRPDAFHAAACLAHAVTLFFQHLR